LLRVRNVCLPAVTSAAIAIDSAAAATIASAAVTATFSIAFSTATSTAATSTAVTTTRALEWKRAARCVAGGDACAVSAMKMNVGVPGLEEVGDEVDRGVDRLARSLVPRRVHVDVCAWVLCVRSGMCVHGGTVVLISRGGWERMADSGGDRTSN